MTRVLAHYLSLETAALGLIELLVSFVIIDVALTAAGSLAGLAVTTPEAVSALAALLALTTAVAAATIGLYRPDACLDPRRAMTDAALAGVVAYPVALLIGGGFAGSLTHPAVFCLAGLPLAALVGILLTHWMFFAIVRRIRLTRRVVILGSPQRVTRIAELLRSRGNRLFEPVNIPADPATLSPDGLRAQRIWGVVLAGECGGTVSTTALLDSKLRGARVLSGTTFCERYLARIDLDAINPDWFLAAEGFSSGRVSAAAKRVCDLLVSLILLVVTLPVMLVTALLIRLESPGPILYRQQRIGLHGKPFTLLKFRSMTVDAEQGGKPLWAQQHDPRVTRVGRYIRPMRIDELPQLLNVLAGQMSMIGPRPERPHFVAQLARIIPFYEERSHVKPGITGWAQVNYPYGASVEDAREKLAYDLYYVKNRGLLFDLLILLSTIRVILLREGAR